MHTITTVLLGLGYFGIGITLFFESGVFLFFLPGDTLLLSAGIYASQGTLSFIPLVLTAIIASALGAMTGFHIGKKFTHGKLQTTFFTPAQIKKTEDFFARFGGYAILLNKFIPIVRTIAPMLAGASNMKEKVFNKNNILGSCLWVLTITSFGFFAGTMFPHIEKYVSVVLASVIIVSFVLFGINYYKNKRFKTVV
ncbi:MAG: DedA family protein [bacterium]